MQLKPLSEKVALITGASGLLGQEHALALASAGATVIMTDVDETALDEAHRRILDYNPEANVEVFYMDVTSKACINDVATTLDSRGTVVTTLINNAAVNPKNDNGNASKGLSDGSEDRLVSQSLVGSPLGWEQEEGP